MKGENGVTGVARQSDRSGLGHVDWPPRPVNRKSYTQIVLQALRHFGKCTSAASRRRAPRGAVAKTLYYPAGVLSGSAGARHHNNATVSPKPRRSDYAHVPKCINGLVSIIQDCIDVFTAPNLPSQSRADCAQQRV